MDMSKLKTVTSLFFLVFSLDTFALNLVEMQKPVGGGLYDNRSCNDLYMQALTLEKESFSYAADRGDKTQVASIVSTVFTPAIYFLGYSAFQDYKQKARSESTFIEIEDIRLRMAEKRCFVK